MKIVLFSTTAKLEWPEGEYGYLPYENIYDGSVESINKNLN